jgi:hypothetical protein
MPALPWLPCGCMAAGAVRISVCALMHVLEPDPEAGNCPGIGLHLYCLTGVHTISWVIVCSLICNQNLACGEGTRLDCYDMISTVGECAMTIITPDRLYSMLSCWLTPIDVMPVQHGRRAAVRSHVV